MNKLTVTAIFAITLSQSYAAQTVNTDLNLDGQKDRCYIDDQSDYPRIKCLIDDKLVFDEDYPDLTSEFNIEAIKGGIAIKLVGKLSESKLRLLYKSGLWTVSDLSFTYYHKDIDSKKTTCKKTLTFTYQDYLKYQDNEALTSQDKGCIDTFNITRSLAKIHDHLNPNTDNGDYPNSVDFFADRKRYIEYLKKYPISRDNEKIYTEMMGWLLKDYHLYNESILIASNILNHNPKSINASLVLAEAYYHLKEDKLAKEYYIKSFKLAKELKIALPETIENHFKSLP